MKKICNLQKNTDYDMKSLYRHLRGIFFILLFFTSYSEIHAQRFLSVVFDKLPTDRQLYARDDNGEATIPISGIIEVNGFTHMSVIVFKDGKPYGYSRGNLNYTSGNAKTSFSMSAKIKAELSEYTLEVYACKSATDSFLMVRREQVLAGDFYLINGQSNAAATTPYRVPVPEYINKFSRTLGRTPDGSEAFTPADTIWKTPDWVTPVEGYWGRDLQRQIIENYKIPVCVINGAIPGTTIAQHLQRNSNSPAQPESIYGHFLYRTLKSQATKIRAFFWYQGEEDAWSNPGAYPERFDQLMKYWQMDFPMVDKFVVVQINVLDQPHYLAGAMREFQRQTKYKYPKTDHFAVMGLSPMQDGVHYTAEGYGKLASQLTAYLGPKVYKSTLIQNVDSPDIQKVFYSTSKDAITLVFDQNQTLKWQADTTVNGVITKLKDQFFLDGIESVPAPISSWDVSGNRITLHLSGTSNATKINYLPSYRLNYYQGPFIRNSRDLGAFSFHEFAISPALANNALVASISTFNTIQLNWQKSADALFYVLEKKAPGESQFTVIKTLDAVNNSYEDIDVAVNSSYSYRIKSYSALSESGLSEVNVKTMPLLSVEPVAKISWKVFPNPAQNYLDIEFPDITSGTLELMSINGKSMLAMDIKSTKTVRMKLTSVPTGVYQAIFKNKNGLISTKRILKM